MKDVLLSNDWEEGLLQEDDHIDSPDLHKYRTGSSLGCAKPPKCLFSYRYMKLMRLLLECALVVFFVLVA
jgi:hypothetical protein